MEDYMIKIERIHRFLEENHYDALVLGRRDNFSWLTGGQEGGVVLSQEQSFVDLVITGEKNLAVSMRADGRKALEEQLRAMEFELVQVDWKSSGKEGYIEEVLKGKTYVADIPLNGATFDPEAIYQLEYPMTDTEVRRYRELGEITEVILSETAKKLKPGMTENDLKKEFLKLCAEYEVEVEVLLLGSDERIGRYRHCTPTDKAIRHTVLLSPVLRKYGLHSNTARMFCLGKADEELKEKYEIVSRIQAEIIGASKEGICFREIFTLQEQLYQRFGCKEEWMVHGHGAPVGYMLSDGGVLYHQERKMQKNQAYEWFVTITGAKSAELVMNVEGKQEVLSVTGKWPVKEYLTEKGNRILLPEILEL